MKTSTYDEKFVVINDLPFNDYMKWIGETSETDGKEKIKLMSLLAKSYVLFYLNGKNKHPSIPEGVSYTAIDSPDMFQKYIWAGGEKTFKIYQTLLKASKNQILLYDGYVPILPYFSCSVGFTFSAQEKRWRVDTPYLQSRYDQEKCVDFQGHGVGLSGKGAQYLATQGRTSAEILDYYYPGVKITTING
jgi:peptidoglycan hydrolase-like amidase